MRRIVVLAAVVLFVSSAGAATGGMPDRYRFTGWMEATTGPGGTPTHLLVDGDGGTLHFDDRWNLTRKPVAYRVCLVKVGLLSGPCRQALAPPNYSGPHAESVLSVFVSCCGDFVARWYVAGRLVAMWPFRYVPEAIRGARELGLSPGLRYCKRPGGPGNYLAASPSVSCATARKVEAKVFSSPCVRRTRCLAYGFTCLAYWDGRYDEPFWDVHHAICRSGSRRIEMDEG
jgi:hypothetical protein